MPSSSIGTASDGRLGRVYTLDHRELLFRAEQMTIPQAEYSFRGIDRRPSSEELVPGAVVGRCIFGRFYLIARRVHERLPQHVLIKDLYSAGIIGLLDAFGRFNPAKEVLFRKYVEYRIRGPILDTLRTLDWSPRQLRRKRRAVEHAIETRTVHFGRSVFGKLVWPISAVCFGPPLGR